MSKQSQGIELMPLPHSCSPGLLVCIEGIDGSGKSTQAQMLHAALPESVLIKFPDYETPLGQRILEMLRSPSPDPMDLQCAMTVNRLERAMDIRGALDKGRVVILDRYWPSGVAYGSADGLDVAWLQTIHATLPMPDVGVLLWMDPTAISARRPDRADAYEANDGRLAQAASGYRDLWRSMSEVPGWVTIDADAPQGVIHDAILRAVKGMQGFAKGVNHPASTTPLNVRVEYPPRSAPDIADLSEEHRELMRRVEEFMQAPMECSDIASLLKDWKPKEVKP